MNEKERFTKYVWPKVKDFFNKYGPANYDGYQKGKGWLGPYIWSENGDTVKVITRFCEEEFGWDIVHNESKICKYMYANFPLKGETAKERKSIDIDITNAKKCKNAKDFRNLKHTLFIEVKHIKKGAIYNDPNKKKEGFINDCAKLQKQLDLKRCGYAIAILIDDGDENGEPFIKKCDKLKNEIKKCCPDVEPLIWQKN
ncbi:MAG TPA: hypothetical protein ENH13_05080 [Euryarchaeota archaeon]|nr:hypothetical protein [Euryarchaeota archaeon]